MRSRSTAFIRLTKRFIRSMRSAGHLVHRRRFLPRSRYRAMACVARGLLAGLLLGPRPPRSGALAALRQKLESQRTRDRRGLDQAHGHAVAEPVGLAAAVADQRVTVFVIAEILAADRARRNEPVGAGIVELDEQSGAGDAGNVSVESARRCGRRGNARAAGRRFRARPSWRGARPPRCAPTSRRACARPRAPAARPRRA